MKKQIAFLLLLMNEVAFAQRDAGVISYERSTNWTQLIKKLTYLSQEEKDRQEQTWKNDAEQKEKMKLVFTTDRSLYTYANDQNETEDGGWSWRNSDYIIQRDFKQGTKTEIIEMLGKTYLVKDSLHAPSWKIMNQLKDIAGFVCMKAITEDTVKRQKITAWFSQDLLIPSGPERLFGLPGIIMELNIDDGTVVVKATNVTFKKVDTELALPKKIKGKKITDADYDRLLKEHINTSMKANRWPYMTIRL